MNSPVQKIKERLSIEEVVSTYIKLDKVGPNLKARCPFHNEKTPSFFVSPERGSYYCFGCAAKGDIFTFVEEFEGLDFKGALKLLADKAGVPLETYSKEMKEAESEKDKLYKVMEDATLFFEQNLKENGEVWSYLKNRGLNEESIKNFRIGFVKNDWRELHSYLTAKGWKDREMELAGLIKKTEKGFYDRFRGRIMFPMSDSSGRIVAFSGRIFEDPSASSGQVIQAKYLNSPDTPIFSKSSVLYGLDKAKESIRKNNFSILVEGQMDLVLSHQSGFRNTIATSGTALSDSTVSEENAEGKLVTNLGLVRRLSENIVLAFDGDDAGFKASNRAAKIALSLGMDVKVAGIEGDMDPADLISKKGVNAWKETIRNSKNVIEFLLDKVLASSGSDLRKAGRVIKEKILPYVDMLTSSIEKNYFIKKISDLSGIPITALNEDLLKVEKESKYEKNETEEILKDESIVFRRDYILRRLLGIILWQKTLTNTTFDAEKILKELSLIINESEGVILEKAKGNEEDFIFEAEVFYGGLINIDKDVEELLLNLKEEYLREAISVKMRELSMFEQKKDKEKSSEILKEISEINNKIEAIKNSRIK